MDLECKLEVGEECGMRYKNYMMGKAYKMRESAYSSALICCHLHTFTNLAVFLYVEAQAVKVSEVVISRLAVSRPPILVHTQ
jgi:hypothetical protein